MTSSKHSRILIDTTVYVPHFLSRLNNRLSSNASDLYLELFGVGINEWRVITVLMKHPGLIAAEIAEQTDIHKGVVSRSLQALSEKGLVTTFVGESQRRVLLTGQGEKLYKDLAQIALMREQILLDGLTDSEVKTLRKLLRKLMDNLPRVMAFHPAQKSSSPAERGSATR
jgi:DNA-binding MarR family transcriptional regulator